MIIKKLTESLKLGDKVKHREYGEGTITKVSDNGNIYVDFGGKKRAWSSDAFDKGYLARSDKEFKPLRTTSVVPKSFGEDDVDFTVLDKHRKQ